MKGMGRAMMGTGEATGEGRAMKAAEAAIANPLLDDVSMKGAKGVLISISGGTDMTLFEVDEAASRIRDEVQDEADIVVGAIFDRNLDGYVPRLGCGDRPRQGRRWSAGRSGGARLGKTCTTRMLRCSRPRSSAFLGCGLPAAFLLIGVGFNSA